MDIKKNLIDFLKTVAVVLGAIWTVAQMNEAAVSNSVNLERRLTRIETLLEQMQKTNH